MTDPARTYWRCYGPRDWREVTVRVRYGHGRGLPAGPELPHVATGDKRPLNVLAEGPDGTAAVVPVRTLRTKETR